MTRNAKPILPPCCDDPEFSAELYADLEGKFDQEAVHLICNHGIFVPGDPAVLLDAVDRLYDRTKYEAETDLSISMSELTEARETAYFLGIAVGRRLGALPLRHNRAKAGAK